jgi:hypothetical protein
MLSPDEFSRTQKLLVDRDNLSLEEASAKFQALEVLLICGPEVKSSPTLQAAVLTAANLANRIQPGCVIIDASDDVRSSSLFVPWPAATFGEALLQTAPQARFGKTSSSRLSIIFGTRQEIARGLQITFDGWVAAIGNVGKISRLRENEKCVLTGVAAGALGVSEIFMSMFNVSVEAGARVTGFSLWRPDLPFTDAAAVGPIVENLPHEAWCLGLGHLGQAYLWALSFLPFTKPEDVNIMLQDIDRTVLANIGTCALSQISDIGKRKTRVVSEWLEKRGFSPATNDRVFDENTKRNDGEPELALCGFDGRGPRHLLESANFRAIVECGLGGRYDNFDSILIHTLPRQTISARDYWSQTAAGGSEAGLNSLLKNNSAYQSHSGNCGVVQMELARRSVAAPFVGAIASSFVIAEVLRMAHGGECFESVDLKLSKPSSIITYKSTKNYDEKLTRMDFRQGSKSA